MSQFPELITAAVRQTRWAVWVTVRKISVQCCLPCGEGSSYVTGTRSSPMVGHINGSSWAPI